MDIYEGLKSCSNEQEALYILKSLSSRISDESMALGYEIDNFIASECETLDLCPDCFGDLVKRMILNEVVEFQGAEVQEEMYENYCENCGWCSEE